MRPDGQCAATQPDPSCDCDAHVSCRNKESYLRPTVEPTGFDCTRVLITFHLLFPSPSEAMPCPYLPRYDSNLTCLFAHVDNGCAKSMADGDEIRSSSLSGRQTSRPTSGLFRLESSSLREMRRLIQVLYGKGPNQEFVTIPIYITMRQLFYLSNSLYASVSLFPSEKM